MSDVSMKKKIAPKDFNPKRILGQHETVRQLILGRVIGQADGITTSVMNDGNVAEGLLGRFMFTPTDLDALKLASTTLWFPSGTGAEFFDGPREGEVIEFGFDIGVCRAENPAGYEWFLKPFGKATVNPLEEVAKRLESGEPPKAIAAPKGKPELVAAPKGKPELVAVEAEPAKAGRRR